MTTLLSIFPEGTIQYDSDKGFMVFFTRPPTLWQRVVLAWVAVKFILLGRC